MGKVTVKDSLAMFLHVSLLDKILFVAQETSPSLQKCNTLV